MVFPPPNLIASIGGMSKFSMMTAVVGAGMVLGLKRMARRMA
ncbi:hypothetical protein [Pseudomonas sp. RW3S2]|nr:hypothetical protein [Pseudomonas sp. RW3S2]